MAEITPAQSLSDDDEEMILTLWDHIHDASADEVDQRLAADLLALRSRAAALLLQQLQGTAPPLSPESWLWVDGVELTARGAAETLAGQAAEIQRALSLLSSRLPAAAADFEEEAQAFLAALRRQAAYTAARRADADEVAALTRMITEKEMQRMAADGLLHPDAATFLAAAAESETAAGASSEEELMMLMRRMAAAEHLVHPATAAFLGYIAGETDASIARGEAPPADELALAPEVEDAAARAEETMAALARRLRRGAAGLFAGDDEALVVAALHRHADNADAARAAVEAFTASVRRFRAAAAGSAPPPTGTTATGCSLRPKL
ncbi:unnamed protein product [Urochloa humidicola]